LIHSLRIANFKSISTTGDNEIELKPLSIFTGPNSSGKSNLLEAIAFLAQIPHHPRDYMRNVESILQHGSLVSYPSTTFIAFCKKTDRPISIEISFSLNAKEQENIKTKYKNIGYRLSYVPQSQSSMQIISLGPNKFAQTIFQRTEKGILNRFLWPEFLSRFAPRESTDQLLSPNIFNPLPVEVTDRQRLEIGEFLKTARFCVDILISKLERTFFVSTLRGAIPSTGKAEGSPTWVGKQGENVLNLLSLIFSKREHSDKAKKIRLWSAKFGLQSMLGGWWGNDQIGVDFEDPALKQVLELNLASFGTRQILTIITQIFWSQEGDTIMIEEPEISLHPESQVRLQELFAEAVRQGKQIICSTHSPFFVLALSRVVKKKLLSINDVAVYHVEKGRNGTQISNLKLNRHGFLESGVPSFMKIEEELFEDWSESLEGE